MSKASDIHEAVAACEKEIFNTPGKIIQKLIKELQGNHGDYPGVSTLKNLDFYRANCPGPNLLLKIN